jgi:hypothetical protein
MGIAGFKTFHRQVRALQHPMMDVEAAAAETCNRSFDGHFVAKPRGDQEPRSCFDYWYSNAVSSYEFLLGVTRKCEEARRASVEPLKIPRVKNDAGWIAVSPFDKNLAAAGQHEFAILTETGPAIASALRDHVLSRHARNSCPKTLLYLPSAGRRKWKSSN